MRPSDLDPSRWREIDAVLERALEASPDELRALLDAAGAEDPALKEEVEALLAARAASETRFETPEIFERGRREAPAGYSEGARIGPFRLLGQIGRGGMGLVYLAEDTRLGRRVALKALPAHLGADAKLRFEAEARAVSSLDHPHVATLYDLHESEHGQLFLIFAYYEGDTLAQRVAHGPLPTSEAVDVAIQIAEGLGAAHRAGIVHRDVKPSNVLLAPDGVKLLDFGVAKVPGHDLTAEGVRLGTVAYMSPEHIRGAPLDAPADLWSLGVVLFETLAGVRPFEGSDAPSVMRAILEENPLPITALAADVPPTLARVLGKALCKDPNARYRSADDLLADLRAVRAGASPPVADREPPPPPNPRIRRLAVLPPANLTGDPQREHLVHGFHDALIAHLGKVRALGVVSRTSARRATQTERTVPEIAHLLNVDAVVEASVARSGEDLTISVQLIAAVPERHVWAETYRRGVEGLLDVAGAVARSIAAELEVTLSPSERTRLAEARSVKPDAYEAYATGLLYLERRDPEGHARAQRHLRRAIELDPGFAPAYAILGEACGSAAFFGLVSPAEGIPMVRSLGEKALALDPNLAPAHALLGAVRHFGDWDWAGAEAALRRAIALNPSYAYAYFMLAEVLNVQNRHAEALATAERHRALERFVPFSSFGPVFVLLAMRDFDRAVARAEAAMEFFTGFWQGPWFLAQALLGRGEAAAAVGPSEAAVELSGRTPMALGPLAHAYARAGRSSDAEAVLSELDTVGRTRYVGATNLAMGYAGLGDVDSAFRSLERAYQKRDMALVHLGYEVYYDPLRGDPRFSDLLQRTGLVSQHSATA